MSKLNEIHESAFLLDAAAARARELAAGYDTQRGETWAAHLRRTVGNAGRLAQTFGPTLLRDAPETALRDAHRVFELADDGEAALLRPLGAKGWKPLAQSPEVGREVGDLVWRWENDGSDTLLVWDGGALVTVSSRSSVVAPHGWVDAWEGGALSPAAMLDLVPVGERRSRALLAVGHELLPTIEPEHVEEARGLLALAERLLRREVDASVVVKAAEAVDERLLVSNDQRGYAARFTVAGLTFAIAEGGTIPSLLGAVTVPAAQLAEIVRQHVPLTTLAHSLAGMPDPLA